MNRSKPIVGGLYASRGSDGMYKIVKVLALDESAIHFRLYANRFDELPQSIASTELTLGGFGHPDGIGIGHFPIARAAFDVEERILVARERVFESELEGYRIGLATMRPNLSFNTDAPRRRLAPSFVAPVNLVR